VFHRGAGRSTSKCLRDDGRYSYFHSSARRAPVFETAPRHPGHLQKMLIQQLRGWKKMAWLTARYIWKSRQSGVHADKDGVALRPALRALSPGQHHGRRGLRTKRRDLLIRFEDVLRSIHMVAKSATRTLVITALWEIDSILVAGWIYLCSF